MVLQVNLFLAQLLFEQGIEHDRGRAGIFQTADSVDVARQR